MNENALTTPKADIKGLNRAHILRYMRLLKTASQSDLVDHTGLSAATVSGIINAFLKEEILVTQKAEKAENAKGRGRPKVQLALNSKRANICVVFFQLQSVTALLVDYTGNTLAAVTSSINKAMMNEQDVRQWLIDTIEKLLTHLPAEERNIDYVSVGFQGVADVNNRVVLWSPITAARDMPVCAWLENHFGAQTTVANDCDMMAVGLSYRHSERFLENFGAVLLSYGVGMGLHLRGENVNGTRSSGVEFGHMTFKPDGALCRCGKRGCVEAYAADYAIARTAYGLPDDAVLNSLSIPTPLDSLPDDIRAGKAEAIAAVEQAGTAVGTALANIYALVDAFPVAFVGFSADLFSFMKPSILTALQNAPGFNPNGSFEIHHFSDAVELVFAGCTFTALKIQDDRFAHMRAVEDM